jgi:hypothetical protein
MIKKLEPTDDMCIKFTDEELAELKLEIGTKFSVKTLDNGSIQLTPFAKVDINLSELSRDDLEQLIIDSCEQDKSINDIVSDILKAFIQEYGEKDVE